MLPHQSCHGKRGPGRPSKALLGLGPRPSPPPVSARRRALLTLYQRCVTVQGRLLAQVEELARVESVLQRFLVHDLAAVASAQDTALLRALVQDVTTMGTEDMTVLIDELTLLVSWLRETHLP